MTIASNEMDNLFLKIIAREIPAEIVYEDEHTVAFLDIKPNNIGHTLVVPRVYFRNIFDVDKDVLGHMITTAQKIAHAQKEGLGAGGVNIVINNEAPASQEIFHIHIHVIPRFVGDHIFVQPTPKIYASGEMAQTADKIKAHLN